MLQEEYKKADAILAVSNRVADNLVIETLYKYFTLFLFVKYWLLLLL